MIVLIHDIYIYILLQVNPILLLDYILLCPTLHLIFYICIYIYLLEGNIYLYYSHKLLNNNKYNNTADSLYGSSLPEQIIHCDSH